MILNRRFITGSYLIFTERFVLKSPLHMLGGKKCRTKQPQAGGLTAIYTAGQSEPNPFPCTRSNPNIRPVQ